MILVINYKEFDEIYFPQKLRNANSECIEYPDTGIQVEI